MRGCCPRSFGHCTHISAACPRVARASRDLSAKTDECCGPSLQCCEGSLPRDSELLCPFRGHSDVSHSIVACQCVADRLGIEPDAESFPCSFFLDLALASSCGAGGLRGGRGAVRNVSGRLNMGPCVSGSSWPVCHVGKTCLSSCSRKVKAGLLSGDECRFFCFRVLSPSGLGWSRVLPTRRRCAAV